MINKYKPGLGKKVGLVVFILGAIAAVFGFVAHLLIPDAGHASERLLGMVSGAGLGITLVGIVLMIRRRSMTPEQKKQWEIDQKDERNIAIKSKAATTAVVWCGAFLVLAAFVLVWQGQLLAGWLMIATLYVYGLAHLFAALYYRKRM